MTINSNKKYKNLKINTEDSQNSSKARNKSDKKKDIKYKTIS